MLGTPDGVLSTVTRSVAAIGDGGHGGDMAGGEELSAPTGIDVRGRKRAMGEGETMAELTAVAEVASTCSGRLLGWRIDDGDLR